MAGRRDAIARKARTFNAPAAGAEINLTPDEGGLWRITWLLFTFTASVAVANRNIAVTVDDGNAVVQRYTTANVQAASSANTYGAYPGVTPGALVGGLVLLAMPDEGIILDQGWHLRTVTALIDVADQYSAITATIEMYPSGPDFIRVPTGLYVEQDLPGAQ